MILPVEHVTLRMEFSSGKCRKLPSETRTSEALHRTDDACAVETFVPSSLLDWLCGSMSPISGWAGKTRAHARAQALVLFRRSVILKGLPDAQTRPAFDCRGAVGQLVDQSRSQPHVGLQLRLVSQEHAFGSRLEPPRERAHFLDCQ